MKKVLARAAVAVAALTAGGATHAQTIAKPSLSLEGAVR